MAYSEKLIKAVKETYPDFPRMHELAETGSAVLGKYLDDLSPWSMSIDTVLKANSLKELQNLAKEYKKKCDLYAMWCKEDPRKG